MVYRSAVFACLSGMFALACSGAGGVDIGPPGNGNDTGTSPPLADGGPGGPIPIDAASVVGPKVTIHVKATTAPFAHQDGYSGQTSRMTAQGIRKFKLLRAANDPQPLVVFDYGNGFVEAGYDDGDDTVVGVVPVAKVLPGTYTIAQMTVTHSRFHVYSTMHVNGGAFPGDFDCIQALSDNTLLDGATRARGWYRYIFTTGGMSFPQEGANAPLPTSPYTGGFTLKFDGGDAYYELPVSLVVPPNVATDVEVAITVNMDHAFRWEDQNLPGYAPGVYDTTPVSFEPVRRYGANSYSIAFID